jgi:hypothetical protein
MLVLRKRATAKPKKDAFSIVEERNQNEQFATISQLLRQMNFQCTFPLLHRVIKLVCSLPDMWIGPVIHTILANLQKSTTTIDDKLLAIWSATCVYHEKTHTVNILYAFHERQQYNFNWDYLYVCSDQTLVNLQLANDQLRFQELHIC